MKKYMRLILILLLCLLTILPLHALAAAANENLGASITGSGSGDTDASDGELSMNVKGSNVNGTLTLTNSGTEAAILSFSYTVDGDKDSFTVAGSSASNTGSYNAELEAGSSIAIYLSVPKKSLFGSDKSATVKLTNVRLEVPKAAKLTVSYNAAGSVSVGGTGVASGTEVDVEPTGTTLTATPVSGATFIGWINTADNSVVSTSASFAYRPTADASLKAVFASSSTEASFWGSNKAYLFEGLSAAVTHASNASDKVIVLAGNGTLSAGNYTIPSGVTLVVPFDSNGTYYTSTPGCDESNWTKPTPYYTLSMASGANITVDGAISVSAKVSGKMGYSGNPTSKYGHVAMNAGSTITVNNGANLYAWGYITGSGNVTIKSGGTVHEAFQAIDWRGGTYTTKMLDNSQKVFPMTQYYAQNVEAPMTLESGAIEECSLAAVISSVLQQKTVPFFGKSGHMFNISSGSVTKWYDGSTDRLVLDVNGDFNIGSISILMSEGIFGIGKVEIKSANYVLPVNNNITININSGSKMTFNQTASLLPGAQVNIAQGATLALGSGKQLFVYDEEEWEGKGYVYSKTDFRPVVYAPGMAHTRTNDADIIDAQIVVNGTLDATAGYLYTTASGGNICSTGNGEVKLQAPQDSPTLYETTQTSDAPAYENISVTVAQLKNADGTYRTTGADTYTYSNGVWNCTNHNYNEGEITTAATCTVDGLKTYTCTACGETKTEVISATGHTAAEAVTENNVDATCTADGSYDSVVKCSVCTAELSRETIPVPAAGHSYGDPTYTWSDDGSSCTASHACPCGTTETETATINNEQSKAPTCIAKGETTYTAEFNADWAATQTKTIADIDMIDHADAENDGDHICDTEGCSKVVTSCSGGTATCLVQATCEECGQPYGEKDTDNHTGNTHTDNVKAETCGEEGYTGDEVCECGVTITKGAPISATGNHSYGDWVVTKEPTTTEPGSRSRTCSICNEVETEDIPMLEIVLDPVVNMTGTVTPATVTAPEGGWQLGENKFTVMCDLACMVAYTEDGESYERLTATAVKDEDGNVLCYEFTVTLTEKTQIAVYIKGDIDGDGTIEGREVTQIKAVQLSDQTTQTRFTALQIMIADVDGDGEIEGREATQIKAAQLNDRVLAW